MDNAKLVVTRSICISTDKTYIEDYCADASALGTTGYAQGSNVIEVPSGDWYFYDEATGWAVMLTIKE